MIETASAQFLGSILREARCAGKPSLFAIYRTVIVRKMNRGSHVLKIFESNTGVRRISQVTTKN